MLKKKQKYVFLASYIFFAISIKDIKYNDDIILSFVNAIEKALDK